MYSVGTSVQSRVQPNLPQFHTQLCNLWFTGVYYQNADKHLEATLPHLRPRWWICTDPLVARHEGAGSTHIRCWVLVMMHVACWPAPPELGGEEADRWRWDNAIIRQGNVKGEAEQAAKSRAKRTTMPWIMEVRCPVTSVEFVYLAKQSDVSCPACACGCQ